MITKLIQSSGLTRSITTRTSLFVVLNLIDLWLTIAMVSMGIGVEGNPVLAGSIWRLVMVKLAVASLVVLFLPSRVGIMRMLNVGLSLVVGWNLVWLVVLVK